MNPSTGLRLLHLPYEASMDLNQRQFGSRNAFMHLAKEGVLSAYSDFSFMSEFKQSGDSELTWRKLLALAKDFQPDLIYWQHLGGFPTTEERLRDLKSSAANPKLVYHEADAYGKYVKRMSTSMRTMMSLSDLVIMSGTGSFFDLARSFGAEQLMLAPQPFDTERSGKPWRPTTGRPNDLVMIANSVQSSVPGRQFPGGRQRRELANGLSGRFGKRFALYGHGWTGYASARGPLPFSHQEETIRSAWLSINWDHYVHVPYYFSNRLPISLAAGVPHITSYHPGYEHVFRDCSGLFWAKSPGEAIDIADYLLSLPRARLIELGRSAQEFARLNLEATKVYSQMFEAITERLFSCSTNASEAAEGGVGS